MGYAKTCNDWVRCPGREETSRKLGKKIGFVETFDHNGDMNAVRKDARFAESPAFILPGNENQCQVEVHSESEACGGTDLNTDGPILL